MPQKAVCVKHVSPYLFTTHLAKYLQQNQAHMQTDAWLCEEQNESKTGALEMFWLAEVMQTA